MAASSSMDRKDVEAAIGAASIGIKPLDPKDVEAFDLTLEVQTQTDKDRVKLVPCRECKRPLIVTTFFAPAKAVCSICTGSDPSSKLASIGVPIPGQTDPAKAVNLADTLVNKGFAFAQCPVGRDDEEHVMELKSVQHNDHYGPGHFTAKDVWVQTAPGETVMHQCLKCNAIVNYSTTQRVQFKRQNEAKKAHPFGAPERNVMLEPRDGERLPGDDGVAIPA